MRNEASLRFSVIIASQGSRDSLACTLKSLLQLDHPSFEVVVVGDAEALKAATRSCGEALRLVRFDDINLSAARNLGIAAAAGDYCAFIDDDAVPDRLWLPRHQDAILEFGASASVGYVRGPDGVRFQSRLESIDCEGESHDEESPDGPAFVPSLGPGRAVKLIGTNMAISRDALLRLRGFDPAFRYYLEDGDMSLRLMQAGHSVVAAPSAEVRHAIAPSSRRTSRRVPRTLHDVGRSSAVFVRRHAAGSSGDIWPRLLEREGRKLKKHMIRGLCEPRDVERVLATLVAGWKEGLEAPIGELPLIDDENNPFHQIVAMTPNRMSH